MQISLKLVENVGQISKDILSALLPQVIFYMDNGISVIKKELPSIIKYRITNTPEYQSLLSGSLMRELGIPESSSRLTGLLNTWSTNIQYQYMRPSISGNAIKSSFSAHSIRADFSDVLYTDYAIVVDAQRGYTLPWLEWLLLDGTKTIVSRHEVVIGSNQFSRTGQALMKPSRRSWKVPSEFAGTIRDNWITRAIDAASSDINLLLARAFS